MITETIESQTETVETTPAPKVRKQRSDKGKPRGKYGPRKPVVEPQDLNKALDTLIGTNN